jgi:Na+-translocating ferredoxin:NAD+ oxidoreductase RNF subunit RnfB
MDIIIPILVISGLGLVFGLGLSYTSKVFEVQVDERIGKVRDMLPGANCGACGFSGCDGMAEAIVTSDVPPSRCPVGGPAGAAAISEFMGTNAGEMEVKVARVTCQGTCNNAGSKYSYSGIESCHAANILSGGMNACNYGCLGLGSCQKVCPFDAIVVENGLARILPEKCTGCTKCVLECPKNIIKMVPAASCYTVLCANQEKGAAARKNCQAACIACQKCVKVCQSAAISVKDNLAVIDPEKCTKCGECKKVCPQKCITVTRAKSA